MDNIKVAKVYASALLEIADEQKKLTEYYDELKNVTDLLLAEEEIWMFFLSPKVAKSKKQSVVDSAFKVSLSKHIYSFFSLLVEHDRISLVKEILDQFSLGLDQLLGRKRTYVYSAKELSEKEVLELKGVLNEKFKAECVIETTIKPSLIGGFVVKFDDSVIDGSIKNHLKRIKKDLLMNKLQSGTFYEN